MESVGDLEALRGLRKDFLMQRDLWAKDLNENRGLFLGHSQIEDHLMDFAQSSDILTKGLWEGIQILMRENESLKGKLKSCQNKINDQKEFFNMKSLEPEVIVKYHNDPIFFFAWMKMILNIEFGANQDTAYGDFATTYQKLSKLNRSK